MPIINIPYKSFRWLLAELVVVTLGIVFAFQIEEFRSSLNDRQEERSSLEAILLDLDLGESEFELWEQALRLNLEHLENIISFVSNPAERDSQTLEELLSVTYSGRLWAPTSPAFSGMRDSGKLGLITDPELQTRLVRFFDIGEPYMLERRIILQEQVSSFFDAFYQDAEIAPSLDFDRDRTFYRELAVTPSEFPTHPEFMLRLSRVYNNTQRTIGIIEDFRLRIGQLRDDIISHLN